MDRDRRPARPPEGLVLTDSAPGAGTPEFIRSGTYAETAEFVDSLKSNRPPRPSPSEVLDSVELCYRIAADALAKAPDAGDEADDKDQAF